MLKSECGTLLFVRPHHIAITPIYKHAVAKRILPSTYWRETITFLSNLLAKVRQDFVSISHVCNGGSNMS